MFLYMILLISLGSFASCKRIQECGIETEGGICSLISDYKNYEPLNKGLQLSQIYTISSISEMNEEKGTITLDVVVKIMWNDTRLTLTK